MDILRDLYVAKKERKERKERLGCHESGLDVAWLTSAYIITQSYYNGNISTQMNKYSLAVYMQRKKKSPAVIGSNIPPVCESIHSDLQNRIQAII